MTDGDFPDIFTDGASVSAGPYGVTLTLHRTNPDTAKEGSLGPTVARIRLNTELAEALAAVLNQVVETHRKAQSEQAGRKPKPQGENGK